MQELGFDGEIEETGSTFKENAKIKAKFIAEKFGLPSLSDDSGLCVECLHGAPGIYSARFSGEGDAGNRKLLLKRMEHTSHRRAYFESAVCLYMPNRQDVLRHGQNVRQNFNRGNRHKRFRIRQPVLFKRLEKELRACNRGRKELGIPPLSRAV